jgi:putative glycosyltransferase (TIGR04372 family)
MMAPAALVVLVAWMVRPLVLIRFGYLGSARLGPFAGETELFLCQRDAGIPGRRTLDIFFCNRPSCNQQLERMWERTLLVSPWAKWPYSLASKLPAFSAHVVPIDSHGDRDVLGLLARTPAHLSFTTEEEQFGQTALPELGLPEGANFICFFARDSAYLDFSFPNRRWDYHNYRDSSIHSYLPAAEELTRRGYFALRMGAIVKEALNTTNPMIVDYATKHRTDFLDIYLGAKCRFFVGDPNGYDSVPLLFRRPVVLVNFIPFEHLLSWDPNCVLIPKRLWLRKEHRFMTFREILDSGVGRIQQSQKYAELGIEIVDNTPEEITALAVEMDERLQGTWRTTEEDGELQRRFWSLFKTSELHGVFLSRVGAEFLRQNQELLA